MTCLQAVDVDNLRKEQAEALAALRHSAAEEPNPAEPPSLVPGESIEPRDPVLAALSPIRSGVPRLQRRTDGIQPQRLDMQIAAQVGA